MLSAERDYDSSSDGEGEGEDGNGGEDGAQGGNDGRASSGAHTSIEDDSIHSFEGHAGEGGVSQAVYNKAPVHEYGISSRRQICRSGTLKSLLLRQKLRQFIWKNVVPIAHQGFAHATGFIGAQHMCGRRASLHTFTGFVGGVVNLCVFGSAHFHYRHGWYLFLG